MMFEGLTRVVVELVVVLVLETLPEGPPTAAVRPELQQAAWDRREAGT